MSVLALSLRVDLALCPRSILAIRPRSLSSLYPCYSTSLSVLALYPCFVLATRTPLVLASNLATAFLLSLFSSSLQGRFSPFLSDLELFSTYSHTYLLSWAVLSRRLTFAVIGRSGKQNKMHAASLLRNARTRSRATSPLRKPKDSRSASQWLTGQLGKWRSYFWYKNTCLTGKEKIRD